MHVILIHLVDPVLRILGVLAVRCVLIVLAVVLGVLVDVVVASSLACRALADSCDVLLVVHALGDDVGLARVVCLLLKRSCSINADLLLILIVVLIIDWRKHLLRLLVFRLYRRHSLVALLLFLLSF